MRDNRVSPIVAVTSDRRLKGAHYYHSAGEKYLQALSQAAGCIPMIMPALADDIVVTELLSRIDGILLTGGYSNIEPHHYAQQPRFEEELIDAQRDRYNLSLIPQVLKAGIPILGICRGLQEINVALGGSLHQRVHQLKGMHDHREDQCAPVDVQYGLAHAVSVKEGGILASLHADTKPMVNSVHAQGIDRLAEGLRAEAVAEDGLIEAVSVIGAKQFALAVQWHPEWQPSDNSFYLSIFSAFGKACRDYKQHHS